MRIRIDSLLTGKIRPLRAIGEPSASAKEPSAIAKAPVTGRVAIGLLGLTGDEQADRRFHGGPDKAIHHYPADHYPAWRDELDDHPLLAAAGAFGENLSTVGLTEREACIGDRFRLGSALVELSQGRQPCWKQGHRLGRPEVTTRMIVTRRSGWYYRVIEPGEAEAGDELALLERPLPQWTVARVFGLLVAGDHRHDPAALPELASLDVLADAWRERAVRLGG